MAAWERILDPPSRPSARGTHGLSAEQYDSLKTASKCFLSERDFSFDEIEAAMAAVFAEAWKVYWKALEVAEEKMTAGVDYTLPRMPLIDGSMPDTDVEMVAATPPILSNDTLISDVADQAREHAEQKANGNVHGKQKKDAGRSFDDLMASVLLNASWRTRQAQ
ncbi:hypothetical protein B0H10DRAFT_1952791 [Mycena sp. CBHHK59/15]|nr:hypothetical protein B0H10DRAFT_1952791 [Mycena sp. CBHHK59/15]